MPSVYRNHSSNGCRCRIFGRNPALLEIIRPVGRRIPATSHMGRNLWVSFRQIDRCVINKCGFFPNHWPQFRAPSGTACDDRYFPLTHAGRILIRAF